MINGVYSKSTAVQFRKQILDHVIPSLSLSLYVFYKFYDIIDLAVFCRDGWKGDFAKLFTFRGVYFSFFFMHAQAPFKLLV